CPIAVSRVREPSPQGDGSRTRLTARRASASRCAAMPATPSDVHNKIERIIDAFEEAWLAGAKPRDEENPTNAGAARRELLLELAFTDLEYRVRDGESFVIEDLRMRFPELTADADGWRGLIAEEFRQRRRLGKNPNKDEYHRRFPDD